MSDDTHPCGARLAALARSELDELRADLAHARTGRDRAVHKARKALQRLRAIAMFLAPIDPVLAARENVRMRRLRRRLAPLRDAAARGETFRLLATRRHWRDFAEHLKELAAIEVQRHAEAWARHPPATAFWDAIDAARRALEERVATWPLERVDRHVVAAVLDKAERRLRKRIKAAVGEHGRELRHEMRRKLRRYANLARAASIAREAADERIESLLSIAKRCGHEGDLWLAVSSARRAARANDGLKPLIDALEAFRRAKCRDHDRLLAKLGGG